VHTGHAGATGLVLERERDGHLAAQPRIVGLELHHLDDLGVRHQPDEPAVVGVGLGGRLARGGRGVVGERDTELATFAGVERVDVTRHDVGHHPPLDGVGVE
jgi:hypothetical protein